MKTIKKGALMMNYTISANNTFPVVQIALQQDETIQIESGSMIYHNGLVELSGHMNSNGKRGLGGLMSAIGRSMTSGESFLSQRQLVRRLMPNWRLRLATPALSKN